MISRNQIILLCEFLCENLTEEDFYKIRRLIRDDFPFRICEQCDCDHCHYCFCLLHDIYYNRPWPKQRCRRFFEEIAYHYHSCIECSECLKCILKIIVQIRPDLKREINKFEFGELEDDRDGDKMAIPPPPMALPPPPLAKRLFKFIVLLILIGATIIIANMFLSYQQDEYIVKNISAVLKDIYNHKIVQHFIFFVEVMLFTLIISIIPTICKYLNKSNSRAAQATFETILFSLTIAFFVIWKFGFDVIGVWLLYTVFIVFILEVGGNIIEQYQINDIPTSEYYRLFRFNNYSDFITIFLLFPMSLKNLSE